MTSILVESKVADRTSAAFIAAFNSILFLEPKSSNSSFSFIIKIVSELDALYRSFGLFDPRSGRLQKKRKGREIGRKEVDC